MILIEDTIANFKRKVVPSGNSAHIPISREFLGDDANIIIKRKYYICKGCAETIMEHNASSPEPGYCYPCHLQREAMKHNKCMICGGPNPIKEF